MLKIKCKLNRYVTKKLASLLEINLINRYESFTKLITLNPQQSS